MGPSAQKRGWERAEGVTSKYYAMLPWTGPGWDELVGVAGMQAPDQAIRGSTWEATSGPFLPPDQRSLEGRPQTLVTPAPTISLNFPPPCIWPH